MCLKELLTLTDRGVVAQPCAQSSACTLESAESI